MTNRWARIAGPGLLLALGLGGWRLYHESRPSLPRHVAIPTSDIGLVPEPAWLVRRGYEIPLTAAQAQEAKAQAAVWDRETAADREALEHAGSSLRGDLDRKQLDTTKTRDFSELSAGLAERRHAAWERIWSTMSEAQRQRVRELRRPAPFEMR